MSLRTQIHDAIDDVSPAAPMLERRVTRFVVDGARAHRRPQWKQRRRLVAPLGLIAVALLLAVLAGIFIAGRLSFKSDSPQPAVGQAELQDLESRPLHYPTVAAGAPCPKSPEVLRSLGMAFGDGPVFMANAEWLQSTDWGGWYSLTFAYEWRQDGLVLIRAHDLQSNAEIGFATYPLAPTGVVAVGARVQTVTAVGHTVQLRSETAFRDPPHTTPMDKKGDLPPLLVLQGLQKGSSGCIGFQIDGPDFTENFVLGP
ncbi:MAG TPA: hypothetical protein VJS19_06005 [Candidatus Dormibacteraeota bacterium]|nr:hypothetical protein [Candidatus Dormibacteraeota bacterium]